MNIISQCSKSSFFVQKFSFNFPWKLSIFWVKNSWKCLGIVKIEFLDKNFTFRKVCFCLLLTKIQAQNTDEDEANAFLEDYNEIYGKLLNNYTIASWNYETNITDENSQIASDSKLQMSKYSAEALEIASQFDSTNFTEDTRRQLKEVCVVFRANEYIYF